MSYKNIEEKYTDMIFNVMRDGKEVKDCTTLWEWEKYIDDEQLLYLWDYGNVSNGIYYLYKKVWHILELREIIDNVEEEFSNIEHIRSKVKNIFNETLYKTINVHERVELSYTESLRILEVMDYDFECYCTVCRIQHQLEYLDLMVNKYGLDNKINKRIEKIYKDTKEIYNRDFLKNLCNMLGDKADYKQIIKKYKKLSEK